MRRYPLKKTIAILFILSLLASPCQAADTLTVTRVIDSATLELSDGRTVSLIGVKVPGDIDKAKEAAEFTRKLVEGKQVRLEYDVQKKDKYGRTLAYVFTLPEFNRHKAMYDDNIYETKCSEEGKVCVFFVNATLIKAGYAQVMTVPPNVKYAELFLKLQKEAKEKGRGLWKIQ